MEVLTDFSLAQTMLLLGGSFAAGIAWGMLWRLVFRLADAWMG